MDKLIIHDLFFKIIHTYSFFSARVLFLFTLCISFPCFHLRCGPVFF